MSNKPIRLGCVGVGNIWKGIHMPGLLKSPDLVLAAVCDNDPENLRRACELYGISEDHCFSDYNELINCPDVDAIDICTSNDLHCPVAIAAVNASKPYLLEKPVALTSRQQQCRPFHANKHARSTALFCPRFGGRR